jgi:hypothetical protein
LTSAFLVRFAAASAIHSTLPHFPGPPSELYPCVFFLLRAPSNRRAFFPILVLCMYLTIPILHGIVSRELWTRPPANLSAPLSPPAPSTGRESRRQNSVFPPFLSNTSALFHFPYPATPLFATLMRILHPGRFYGMKTAGVYTNNSHSGICHSSSVRGACPACPDSVVDRVGPLNPSLSAPAPSSRLPWCPASGGSAACGDSIFSLSLQPLTFNLQPLCPSPLSRSAHSAFSVTSAVKSFFPFRPSTFDLAVRLSPLAATLTKNKGEGPACQLHSFPYLLTSFTSSLPYTLPSSVSRSPFVCHSYANLHPGRFCGTKTAGVCTNNSHSGTLHSSLITLHSFTLPRRSPFGRKLTHALAKQSPAELQPRPRGSPA